MASVHGLHPRRLLHSGASITLSQIKKMIDKLSHDEESVWIFAFRYALGRNTTAPWLVSTFLRRNIERIMPVFLEQMANEIECTYFNHPIPEDWQMLLDAIQTELSKQHK
jgi:hypothetical protein